APIPRFGGRLLAGACGHVALVAQAGRDAEGRASRELVLGRNGRRDGGANGAGNGRGHPQRPGARRRLGSRGTRRGLLDFLRGLEVATPRAANVKNALRELRKARGLSQADLAETVEVSRQTINAVAADKYDPSLPMAYKLAALFDVPVEAPILNPVRAERSGGSRCSGAA